MHTWILAAMIQTCTEAWGPSCLVPVRLHAKMRREGPQALCLLGLHQPKSKEAWSPESLSPCFHRESPRGRERILSLCLLQAWSSKSLPPSSAGTERDPVYLTTCEIA